MSSFLIKTGQSAALLGTTMPYVKRVLSFLPRHRIYNLDMTLLSFLVLVSYCDVSLALILKLIVLLSVLTVLSCSGSLSPLPSPFSPLPSPPPSLSGQGSPKVHHLKLTQKLCPLINIKAHNSTLYTLPY